MQIGYRKLVKIDFSDYNLKMNDPKRINILDSEATEILNIVIIYRLTMTFNVAIDKN